MKRKREVRRDNEFLCWLDLGPSLASYVAPRQPLLCEEPILCKSELPSRRSARARARAPKSKY